MLERDHEKEKTENILQAVVNSTALSIQVNEGGGCQREGRSGERSFVGEHFLDWEFEETGDLERERQTGIIFPGLERVDGLTRDAKSIREIALRPFTVGAKFA